MSRATENSDGRKWRTKKQMAEILGVSLRTVERRMRAGELEKKSIQGKHGPQTLIRRKSKPYKTMSSITKKSVEGNEASSPGLLAVGKQANNSNSDAVDVAPVAGRPATHDDVAGDVTPVAGCVGGRVAGDVAATPADVAGDSGSDTRNVGPACGPAPLVVRLLGLPLAVGLQVQQALSGLHVEFLPEGASDAIPDLLIVEPVSESTFGRPFPVSESTRVLVVSWLKDSFHRAQALARPGVIGFVGLPMNERAKKALRQSIAGIEGEDLE